jgi:hypothetical protein
MARRGSDTRRLPGQVLVRLTSEQNAAVVARAQAARVSTATWLRRLIADAIGVERGPVTSRAIPPTIVLEIAHLRVAAGEISDAIYDAANVAREQGYEDDFAAIWSRLDDVKKIVLQLDQLKEKLWPPAA